MGTMFVICNDVYSAKLTNVYRERRQYAPMAELHTLVCRIRYHGNVTTSMCGGDKNLDKVEWAFLHDNSMEEKCTQ